MPADLFSPPSASTLTLSALRELVAIYHQVLGKFYQTKVKDDKQRQAAIETDEWRYHILPKTSATFNRGTNEGGGISLDQLERLVNWKITHGKYRPFLLPKIRENAADTVREETAKARVSTIPTTVTKDWDSHATPSDAVLKKALDMVCVLKGVGPATGTLILSVFNPECIPFFQDELYMWLVATKEGSPNTTKLKYNTKEYFELVEQLRQMRTRLGSNKSVRVWEIEKASFVAMHWGLVDDKHRKSIWASMHEDNTEEMSQNLGAKSVQDDSETDIAEEGTRAPAQQHAAQSRKAIKTGENTNKTSSQPSAEKRAAPQSTANRRSKRTKK